MYIYAYIYKRSIKAHIFIYIQYGGRLLTRGRALIRVSRLFIGKRSLQISLQTNEEAGSRIHLGNDPGGFIAHLRHVILGGGMRMLLAGTFTTI